MSLSSIFENVDRSKIGRLLLKKKTYDVCLYEEGISLVNGELPAQMASSAENLIQIQIQIQNSFIVIHIHNVKNTEYAKLQVKHSKQQSLIT